MKAENNWFIMRDRLKAGLNIEEALNIGDIVEVIDKGQIYSTYYSMAIKLGADVDPVFLPYAERNVNVNSNVHWFEVQQDKKYKWQSKRNGYTLELELDQKYKWQSGKHAIWKDWKILSIEKLKFSRSIIYLIEKNDIQLLIGFKGLKLQIKKDFFELSDFLI